MPSAQQSLMVSPLANSYKDMLTEVIKMDRKGCFAPKLFFCDRRERHYQSLLKRKFGAPLPQLLCCLEPVKHWHIKVEEYKVELLPNCVGLNDSVDCKLTIQGSFYLVVAIDGLEKLLEHEEIVG
jgi:hypothetical protein